MTRSGWLTAGLILAAVPTFAATATVARAETIAHWRFEDAQDLGADSAPGGHDLTVAGVTGSSDRAAGAPGSGSAYFNGSQTAFSTINTLDLTGYREITVSFYLKTTSSVVSSIFEHSPSGQVSGAFGAYLNDVTPFEAFQRGATGGTFLDGASYPGDGEWHYWEVTISTTEAEAHHIVVYRDGAFVPDTSGYNALSWPVVPGFLDDYFFIGTRGNESYKLTGFLDELKITGVRLDNVNVPEPGSLALLGGLSSLAVARRLRTRTGRV